MGRGLIYETHILGLAKFPRLHDEFRRLLDKRIFPASKMNIPGKRELRNAKYMSFLLHVGRLIEDTQNIWTFVRHKVCWPRGHQFSGSPSGSGEGSRATGRGLLDIFLENLRSIFLCRFIAFEHLSNLLATQCFRVGSSSMLGPPGPAFPAPVHLVRSRLLFWPLPLPPRSHEGVAPGLGLGLGYLLSATAFHLL